MRVVSGSQLTLDFEPSVRQRFGTLRECVYHAALADPRGIKAVAFDCDKSQSELSRCLNPSADDPRSCDVNLMVDVMRSTKNLAPLQWLLAEFVPDEDSRRLAALSQLEQLLPTLTGLVSEAKRAKR
jgi:hypothetical protein